MITVPACLIAVLLLVPNLQTADAQPLRVGITPDFPPIAFREGRDLAGLEVDFSRALGQALNRRVELVELSWEKQIPSLVEGKVDIIMSSMSITKARRTQIEFASPYLRVGQMALVRREDQNKYFLGFPTVLPGTVGVMRGTTGDFLVQQEWSKAKRKEYSDPESAADALLRKKIALFISDAPVVWWLAGKYESRGLATVPTLLTEEELAWGVRRSDAELLQAANQFLEKIREDGTLKAMIQRWLPTVR